MTASVAGLRANAGQSAYPKGWEGYQAMASYDRLNWFRVPTSFDGQVMTINHTPEYDSVYYAYFEPYSWERHLSLLDSAQLSALTQLVDLGSTNGTYVNGGRVANETRTLKLGDELALLPAPFFDARDNRRLELPVVLPKAASQQQLRSAGVVASWFGALAGYRSARFPVSIDELPQRNAVVFVSGGRLPTGLSAEQVPPVEVPTIAVIAHPQDPHVKLLLIQGKDDAQLKLAADALADADAEATEIIRSHRAPDHDRGGRGRRLPERIHHGRSHLLLRKGRRGALRAAVRRAGDIAPESCGEQFQTAMRLV